MLLSLFTVNALQLNPSTITADVSAGFPSNYSVSITNNQPYKIYNINLESSPDISFTKISEIASNQTATATLTVLTSTQYSSTITPKVKFDYYVDIPPQPKTYEINVTSNSFILSTLNIIQNDKVKWFNSDVNEHRIRQNDGNINPTFDFTLQQNQYSNEITFPDVATITYYEVFLNQNIFSGVINVLNSSEPQLTTNPDLNTPLTININSNLLNTTVSLEVFDQNFTVEYNGTAEGGLRVNNGANKAFNVHLSGEWLEFLENDFTIEKNSNNLLLFKVKPIILNTADTNKTYIKTIKVTGSNFNEVNHAISIFIPYHIIPTVSNATESELIEEINRLRELLNSFNFSTSEPQIIFKDPEVNINLTASELRDLLLNFRNIASTVDRSANIQRQDTDAIKSELNSLNETQFLIQQKQIETEERQRDQNIIFWGVIGALIIISSVWVTFNYIQGYQRTKFQRAIYFSKKER